MEDPFLKRVILRARYAERKKSEKDSDEAKNVRPEALLTPIYGGVTANGDRGRFWHVAPDGKSLVETGDKNVVGRNMRRDLEPARADFDVAPVIQGTMTNAVEHLK